MGADVLERMRRVIQRTVGGWLCPVHREEWGSLERACQCPCAAEAVAQARLEARAAALEAVDQQNAGTTDALLLASLEQAADLEAARAVSDDLLLTVLGQGADVAAARDAADGLALTVLLLDADLADQRALSATQAAALERQQVALDELALMALLGALGTPDDALGGLLL